MGIADARLTPELSHNSSQEIMEPQLNQEVINTAAQHDGPIETDAVIIGAGPVGLFQVFELGLLEIKAHIIDSLAYPGGQPIELYPDKPIYDIPAIPVCTGKELTDSLMKQIEPFGPTFHLGQEVSVLDKQEDGRFFVETSKGTKFLTKTIFIAAGVGAFQPKLLRVPGLGVKAVNAIVHARKWRSLRLEDVGRLTVSIAKVRPFLIAEGWSPGALTDAQDLRALLAPKVEQLELFA